MAAKEKTLTFKQFVNAPPAEATRAFVHATCLRDWLCDAAQVEARAGGRLYLWWNSGFYAAGAITALEPGRRVAFSWAGQDEPAPTRVTVRVKEQAGGTLVTLAHSGLGSGKAWAPMIRETEAGWPASLENLASVVETGIDLRAARRPRLGIFTGEFNAEIAAALSVPTSAGLRVEGTAEATGARAAGLQKDDVIVKLNGKTVADFPTLSRALQGLNAGDKPAVVYYRGREKRTTPLELSNFPQRDVPAAGAELAEIVRATHAEIDAGFDGLLDGVSEAEAEHRPAESEWNAKELIAHFIATERDYQSWVADMLNDAAVNDFLDFRPNVTVRLRALVKRLGTLAGLREELTRAQAETVDLLAALPESFTRHRRHLYRRAALWVLEITPGHFRDEHSEQFKHTLAAARPAAK